MVTRAFFTGVVEDDQVPECVADIDTGLDWTMAECARP
jgi:hypothetical protein